MSTFGSEIFATRKFCEFSKSGADCKILFWFIIKSLFANFLQKFMCHSLYFQMQKLCDFLISVNFKSKNKSVWSNVFLIWNSKYILKVHSIHYTLRQDTSSKKRLVDKVNVAKMDSFFLLQAPTHEILTFKSQFFKLLNAQGLSL